MSVHHSKSMPNKWITKIRKKKEHETAAAYQSDDLSFEAQFDASRKDRHTLPSAGIYSRTLRGVRK